jgi:hypothetical protein
MELAAGSIAGLAPVNDMSWRALNHLHNYDHFFKFLPQPDGLPASRFTFGQTLSRRFFTFGTSRLMAIQFQRSPSVGAHHFVLFIDVVDRQLCIKATSSARMLLLLPGQSSKNLSYRKSATLQGSVTIQLGGDSLAC